MSIGIIRFNLWEFTQSSKKINSDDFFQTTLILGLCLPEICTTEDLAEVLKKILREELLVMSNFYTGSYTLLNVKDLKDDYYYLLNWKIIIVGYEIV